MRTTALVVAVAVGLAGCAGTEDDATTPVAYEIAASGVECAGADQSTTFGTSDGRTLHLCRWYCTAWHGETGVVVTAQFELAGAGWRYTDEWAERDPYCP